MMDFKGQKIFSLQISKFQKGKKNKSKKMMKLVVKSLTFAILPGHFPETDTKIV